MEIEFDPAKRASNQKKHGIDFVGCEVVFDDPCALTRQDKDHQETRFITMGQDATGRLLVVAYTWRGDVARIISAGKALRHESRHYPNC